MNARDERIWSEVRSASLKVSTFTELLRLSVLRRKAKAAEILESGAPHGKLRVALLTGITLHPIPELLEFLFWVERIELSLFKGEFKNYVAELHGTRLKDFAPNVVVLFPADDECFYRGPLLAPADEQKTAASEHANELLALCKLANERLGVDVILASYAPAMNHDWGSLRNKLPGSDWNFRRLVNLYVGFNAPSCVHICDVEFLATRIGISAIDRRSWFEAKQPFSPLMQTAVARELVAVTARLRRAPKKVLVLDLDNTLWGGVIGDDGLEGIEIGTTSPRGEAFRAFQSYVRRLAERGVLLAVASKNTHDIAIEPFRSHPEMVLREQDFVAFEANWGPKSDSISRIAKQLDLGLDSFVFVDDNPAEIAIVEQHLPMVSSIHLGEDPSTFVSRLADSRYFEGLGITAEDTQRTAQYRAERERKDLEVSSAGDFQAYLRSLQMRGFVNPIDAIDLPRCAQLINKSNQFNLTTRRRSEAELKAFLVSPESIAFSFRLHDRFGDNGIIAVVLGVTHGKELEIDTWVMSCRVLQRGVERETLREIQRLAKTRGVTRIRGRYVPTSKNGLVKDLYPSLGFEERVDESDSLAYVLEFDEIDDTPGHIEVTRSYDATRSHSSPADSL